MIRKACRISVPVGKLKADITTGGANANEDQRLFLLWPCRTRYLMHSSQDHTFLYERVSDYLDNMNNIVWPYFLATKDPKGYLHSPGPRSKTNLLLKFSHRDFSLLLSNINPMFN